jgi:hypothetical protein
MAGMLGTVAGDDNTGELVITRDTPAELEALYAAHARSLTQALYAAGYPDAVQEAFVQAVVHWRKVSRYDDPLAWIRRVAINRGHVTITVLPSPGSTTSVPLPTSTTVPNTATTTTP